MNHSKFSLLQDGYSDISDHIAGLKTGFYDGPRILLPLSQDEVYTASISGTVEVQVGSGQRSYDVGRDLEAGTCQLPCQHAVRGLLASVRWSWASLARLLGRVLVEIEAVFLKGDKNELFGRRKVHLKHSANLL